MAELPKAAVLRSIAKEDVCNRMRENMERFRHLPRFFCGHTVSVIGFGPTLKETWHEIHTAYPIITTSGAHDFLIERGVIPTYHVECDPRPHKLNFLRNPHPKVTYLIASTCDSRMFKQLRRYKVVMWHPMTEAHEEQKKMVAEVEYGAHLIGGGSNAGLRALLLGFHMGHRTFHTFGLDCSYKDREIWAGKHYGKEHSMIEVECNGKRFWTSDIMYNACQDFVELMQSPLLTGSKFIIHGESLLFERVILARDDMQSAVHDWIRPVQQEAA